MRWDNQTSGAVTIINEHQVTVFDENGSVTPFVFFTGEGDDAQPHSMSQFFWDIDGFVARHNIGPVSPTNGPVYNFTATPSIGGEHPYDTLSCQVDFRYGVVTVFSLVKGDETSLRVEQFDPLEVASGIW